MRRGNDNSILFLDSLNKDIYKRKNDEPNRFIGVNLGADYCAEHEWGIKRINYFFQRDKANFKISKPVGKDDEHLIFVRSKKNVIGALVFENDGINKIKFQTLKDLDGESSVSNFKKVIGQCYHDLFMYDKKNCFTAWDDGSFGIVINGFEEVEHLRDLYEAFKVGDVAIWLGGGGPFQNSGLCLAIFSRLPKSVIKSWEATYEDQHKLQEAVSKTGIVEKLKKAEKKYFALSPAWAHSFKDIVSKYPVVFWLNPFEQSQYKSTWATVEDLEDWIKEKGKIIIG
jgi:hypothetical protein